MDSLYTISNELLNTLGDIEANDGEMTESQIEELEIKQNELESKLTDYVKAIQVFKANADAAKAEKKRIGDIQNKFTNRINRLKESMLHAVELFGNAGKSNKYIDLPIGRIYTKISKSIEIDDERINLFLTYFRNYLVDLCTNGIVENCGKDVMEYILSCINANYKADYPNTYVPFTIGDLRCIKITISQTETVFNMLNKFSDTLYLFGRNNICVNMENATDKDCAKLAISNSSAYEDENEENENEKITVARESKSNSLCIK